MAGQAEDSGSGALTHGGLTGALGESCPSCRKYKFACQCSAAAGQSAQGGGLAGGLGTRHYCGICAGLIPEPGVNYNYSGKVCHCLKQLGPALGSAEPTMPNTLKKWWEHESQKAAAPPTMTPYDFVMWMRGFFAGRSVLPTDPQLEALLRATLNQVKT